MPNQSLQSVSTSSITSPSSPPPPSSRDKFAHFIATICNRRMLIIIAQGFASGLPLAIVGSTLQAWFAISGISVLAIGALTLVGQPYVYKFLWSPLLDRYSLPFLGRRRGWMLITQLGLTVGILLCSLFNPIDNATILAVLALAIAMLSATQDIAIDAYRTELFSPAERGLSVALYAGGYRIAMLISSGVALIIADNLGWAVMYQIMAGLMLVAALITIFASPEPKLAAQPNAPVTLRQAITAPLQEFWQRPAILSILAFIVLYKLTDVVALSLGSKFLIDLGFTLTNIGVVYKGVGLVAVLCGTFCGGLLMIRISLFTALLWFGVLQALSNLTFAWLAIVGKNMHLLIFAVFSENFCSGLGTVAFLALLMHLCNIRYTATQFALLSSLAVIGRAYFGPFAGILAQSLHVASNHSNWAIFYVCAFLAAFPSFFLLYYLRRKNIFAL